MRLQAQGRYAGSPQCGEKPRLRPSSVPDEDTVPGAETQDSKSAVGSTAQSLRDCLNGRIGEALRLQAQGRYAGSPQCGEKPRLRPSSVPDEDTVPGAETQDSKSAVGSTAQSLRDCLNGRIGEALRLQAQGRYAGSPQCGEKPRLRPSSVPDEDTVPGAETQDSKSAVGSTAQSLRDCLNGRIGEALRLQAQGRYAGSPQCGEKPRLRPSSVPDEDTVPGAETQDSNTKPARLAPGGLCV
ncbi:hypothetical protein [Massilia sp. H6]|uniref:hypothetical protein n=1 Tax=Massilia sp. H6 TaxID=2970464 RepID=UPI002168CA84|nr:hypothetical protein [Massilia sp. H6]UVW29855.1 hypothetical protein NRS07_06960 [Massilia sp. H6]